MSEPDVGVQPVDEAGPLAPGTRVGDYEIQHLLGKGGMGWVYAAVHPLIGKRAAVKVLQPGLATHASSVARFLAEARAANKVGHPGIIDIFAFGELPSKAPYFVMEHLVGESLRERLERGPLGPAEAREVLGQMLDALGAAHRAGVVHRDLKPDNLFLCAGPGAAPRVKLLDFGVAKLTESGVSTGMTQTGVPIGSPAYMSPEQCLGQVADHRSDLYSTGVLLYELFTGQLPFRRNSYMEMLIAQVNQPPPPPRQFARVPEELERLILWCLEKKPEARPADVPTLAAHLLPCLGRLAQAAGEGPAGHRASLQAGGAQALPGRPVTPGPPPPDPRGPGAPDPLAATLAATSARATPAPSPPQAGQATPYLGGPPFAGPPTPYPGGQPSPYLGGPPFAGPPTPYAGGQPTPFAGQALPQAPVPTPYPSAPGYGTPPPGTTTGAPFPGGRVGQGPAAPRKSVSVWIVLLVLGLIGAGVIALAVGLSSDSGKPSGTTASSDPGDPGKSLPDPGKLVLANWTKDLYWYPATVVEREGQRLRVQYVDGQSEWIEGDRLAPLEFQVGQRVQTLTPSATYVWTTVMRVEPGKLLLKDDAGHQAWRPIALVRTTR